MVRIEDEKDVIVVGGGPSGFCAAVASARNGADTLLVKQHGFLFGMATAGLVPHFDGFTTTEGELVVKGIADELVQRLVEEGGAMGYLRYPYWGVDVPYDPEVLKLVSMEMAEEAGVELLLHTFASDSIVKGDEVRGVVIQNKSGRSLLLGRRVIDCTGDADVAASAGVPFKKGREEDGLCMGASFQFQMGNIHVEEVAKFVEAQPPHPIRFVKGVRPGQRKESYIRIVGDMPRQAMEKEELPKDFDRFYLEFIREGEAVIGHPHVLEIDATHTKDLTRAQIEGRRLVFKMAEVLKKYVPGFQDSYVCHIPPSIGIRESRRILGRYILTEEDVLEGRDFPDGVARGAWPIDLHYTSRRMEEGEKRFAFLKGHYHIPYRCLLPQGVENLLVAGRAISASREAFGSLRVMPTCMATGQAAGTAAALSLKSKIPPSRLNVDLLRKTLIEQGVHI